MCGSTNPVNTALRVVTVDVGVDILRGREIRGLLIVTCELKSVKLFGTAPSKADLTVDGAGGLAEDCLFGRNEPCVTRKVLTDPSAGLGSNETRLALAL